MNDAKRKLVPALAALGGSLATFQASALEIGGITLQSTLGEPLRASIAYALGPNEELAEYCISLRRAAPGSTIPSISRATVSVDQGLIRITGSTALREPLATLRLDISCPYTPKLSREYTLMIDPASQQSLAGTEAPRTPQPARTAAGAEPAAETAAQSRSATSAAGPAADPAPALEPLFAGDRVFVEPGLTLSRIIAAVDDRAVEYAEAIERIVGANPSAFVDGDPNKLEAGSWLSIPDLGSTGLAANPSPAPVAEPAEGASAAVDPTYPTAPAEPGQAGSDARAVPGEPLATAGAAPATAAGPDNSDGTPPPAEALTLSAPNAGRIDDTEFLEPVPDPAVADDRAAFSGDALPEPGTAPAGSNTAVTTRANGQGPERAREAVDADPVATPAATPVRRVPDSAAGTPTFWYVLIGGGAALIAGLLALLFRRRFSTDPAAPERTQPRENPLLERVKQAEGIEVEPIQAFTAPDFDLRDDSPTAENPTLTAETAPPDGFDEDGAVAAALGSGADHHAHQDVDIDLGAIYDEGSGEGNDPSPAGTDDGSNDVDVDLSSGRDIESDDDVDADLSSGSGFDAGEHTRAGEDFAFAATTALDFELPEEREAGPQPKTDVIPPLNIEESSILKSEVLPEDEDDDYDMSVILDATKQPDPREVTEKDLHAVVVDAGDSTMSSGDYTIARDSDFEMLEQDYEEELSATQALNMEIERAALELANHIGEEPDEQLTQELPTSVSAPEEEAPTAVASLDEDGELATDVAPLDDETIDAAFAGSDDEAPTAIAPLEEDEGPPTAILDDETIDAALAAADDEAATAIAPLDEDDEPATDIASLEDTSIESQLAHLPGEGSADAANDDALLDDDADPTGITAALRSEITEEDKTVEIARDDEDETISLSRDGDDDTVEMPPRSKNA